MRILISGSWPWLVALRNEEQSEYAGSFIVLCGASLISEQWILSAAHCFKKENLPKIARLGEVNITQDDDGATPEDITIANIILHPQYHNGTHVNDIALIYLNRPITYKCMIFIW